MFLTERTEGTDTTVSNPGGIEHAQRPIVFGAAFLWIERGPLPTTQRAISLRKKVVSPQASDSRGTRPLRGTERWFSRRGVR
jgi:hypothetical protein